MNRMAKKIMICLLAGIVQVGIGTILIEASPLYNENLPQIVQLDQQQDQGSESAAQKRHEQERHERERHDHEYTGG